MKKLLVCIMLVFAAVWALLWHLGSASPLLEDTDYGKLVLDVNGGMLRLGLAKDGRYRLPARLDQISPAAVKATLEYEDKYFFSHPGINLFSMCRAAVSLIRDRHMGASTITMQVARLRYSLKTGDLLDKIKQIGLALAIEMRHSKEEILEAYFNLAPYGGNIEGIEAASRIYFRKDAARLTESESIALAIVPQNPVGRHPVNGRLFEAARKRLAIRMGSLDGARALRVNAQSSLPFRAPHLVLEIMAEAQGNIIQTGLEPDLQYMLERTLASFASRERRNGLANAAAMLVRWQDMQTVAHAGSTNYHSQEISGQIDGTRIRRSPGSTLKPFIYALALDGGLIHPATVLPDSPHSFGGYDPANMDRQFKGPVQAADALRSSRNLPAVFLAEQLPYPGLYGFLRNAGVEFKEDADHYGLALVLGGAEVTMRELCALYAMLANKGVWQPVRLRSSKASEAGKRILSPEAAWLTLKMLERPEAVVHSRGRPIPVYYKTGTSNGMRDAWTLGIIGNYVLAVWVGNFDNSSNPHLIGSKAALPVFEEIACALADLRNLTPPLASPANLDLVQVEVCSNTGDLYKGQCADKQDIWFIQGKSPSRDSGILRPVWIDRESGLRACVPDAPGTEKIWWEFWPSDMLKIFANAGINKPAPPPWQTLCDKKEYINSRGPRIMLPKKNVVYKREEGEKLFRLPLQAAADIDASTIYWYARDKYLGSTKGSEIIFWDAPAGEYILTAVDASGKSARQVCRIEGNPE